MTDKSTPNDSKPRLSLKLSSPQSQEPPQQSTAPDKPVEPITPPDKPDPVKQDLPPNAPKLKLQKQSEAPSTPSTAAPVESPLPASTEKAPVVKEVINVESEPKAQNEPPVPPIDKPAPAPLKVKRPGPQPIAPPPLDPVSAQAPDLSQPGAEPNASKQKNGKSKKSWLFIALLVAILAIAFTQRETILSFWSDHSASSSEVTGTPAGLVRDRSAVPSSVDSGGRTETPAGDARIQAFVDELPINMVRDSVASPAVIIDRITYRPGDLIDPGVGLRLYGVDSAQRRISFIDTQERLYHRRY